MNPGSWKLVCFAVKEEAKPFKELTRGRDDVQILLTGMGGNNAERAVRLLLKNSRPSLVVSAGFAGGLKPGLASGSILYANVEDTALHKALRAAGALPGRFHFSQRVAARAEEKQKLYAISGADAVEMESQVVCAVCREHKVPSFTLRVVLDTAEEDLPLDFNQFMTPDERMDMGKLALAAIKNPGKIPHLLRLGKQSAAAAKRLAEVLERALLQGTR